MPIFVAPSIIAPSDNKTYKIFRLFAGGGVDKELNRQEKQVLLGIARQAVVQGVLTGKEYIEPREEIV